MRTLSQRQSPQLTTLPVAIVLTLFITGVMPLPKASTSETLQSSESIGSLTLSNREMSAFAQEEPPCETCQPDPNPGPSRDGFFRRILRFLFRLLFGGL